MCKISISKISHIVTAFQLQQVQLLRSHLLSQQLIIRVPLGNWLQRSGQEASSWEAAY